MSRRRAIGVAIVFLALVVIIALAATYCTPSLRLAITPAPQVQRSAPAAARATDEGRAYVYAGLPRSQEPVTILKDTGYILGYSESHKDPLWVAYRLFRVDNPVAPERPTRFTVDDRTEAKVRPQDYTRTGYDRGHMAPNYGIATRYGEQAQVETFLMSNIVPQKPALNRYVWKELEMKVAKDYANRLEEVWVICGPVFDGDIEKLASGVEIPDAFYKIIVDEENGHIRVLAFTMPQGVDSGDKDRLAKFLSSVDEIERQTGLDFLYELPDEIEDALEASVPQEIW